MGKYNSEYESYYAKILQRQRTQNPYAAYGVQETNTNKREYSSGANNFNGINRNVIVSRIMQELIGVLCLTAFVIVCKTISTPQTTVAYKYAKDIINNNLDYNKYLDPKIVSYISNINFKDTTSLRDDLEDYIETFKSNVTGEKTLKEKAKESFVTPVKGKVDSDLSAKQTDKSIVIDINENTEVIAPNEGTVKKVADEKDFGSYIIIDHGNGIETKCSGLKEIGVKEGEKVDKGQFLGKSQSIKSLNKACVIFSLSYMGENKDPKEYMTF